MGEHYRYIHGKRIKVDSDPENDYMDGWNGNERFWKRKLPSIRVWWFALGMLVEFLLFVFVLEK